MRRIVAISLFLLAALAFERVDVATVKAEHKSEIVDLHKVQLECNHCHNINAERPSPLVVPSARTTVTNTPRTHTLRAPHITATGHFSTITKYVVARHLHRLGSLPRAVDFYLYTLCQLRL